MGKDTWGEGSGSGTEGRGRAGLFFVGDIGFACSQDRLQSSIRGGDVQWEEGEDGIRDLPSILDQQWNPT